MFLLPVSAVLTETNKSNIYISDATPYGTMFCIEESTSGMADNLNFVKVCFSNFEKVYSEKYNNFFLNYTMDSLYSSEEILKNIFKTTGNELKKNSYDYNEDITTNFSEKEYTEGYLKIKLTEEKSVISKIPDTYVSIKRRYVYKNGEYQLSTVNVIAEIGKEGVYYNASDDYAPLVSDHISTENPICGYMQIPNYTGKYPNPIIIKFPVCSSKYSYEYFDSYTVLKNTIYVDPEIRFTYPEYWNDAVMFNTEIKYATVDANYSVTGKSVELYDYGNYQIVNIRREITLVSPDIEEYKSPQTGTDVFAYAAVAAVALAAAVVLKKRRRRV